MPYAPTVNDNSGQILAAGINQGIAGLSKGIDEYMRKKDEKEKQEQAFALLRAASDAAIPDDALRAGIKGLGGAGAFQVAQQVSQQKRQADLDKQTAMLNAAHLKGINDAAEQLARDRNAVTQAFNPAGNLAPAIQGGASFEQLPTAAPQDMQSMVMQAARNGASPQTLSHLANMADNLAQAQQRATPRPERMPVAMNLDGMKGVWDGANWKPAAAPKAPAADRSLAAELTRLDTSAAEAEAAGNTALAATLREAMKYKANGGGALSNEAIARDLARIVGGNPPAATTPDAPATPPKPATAAPAPAKGTRARQNGRIYEFDGKTWVEVK